MVMNWKLARTTRHNQLTELVLGLGNPSTTLLKVGTGGGASVGVHGIGGTGTQGEGGSSGAGAMGWRRRCAWHLDVSRRSSGNVEVWHRGARGIPIRMPASSARPTQASASGEVSV